MLIMFGISNPIAWKPGYDSTRFFKRVYWLWFEAVFASDDFVTFQANTFVNILIKDIDEHGGEVTYHRTN